MAERKFFLTSSGITEETAPALQQLLGRSFYDTSVGFVFVPGTNSKDRARSIATSLSLAERGFKIHPIDLGLHSFNSLATVLSKIHMLYVNSGNTFELMNWVRKSGLGSHLRNNNLQEIIYCGSSAGSLAAGPDITLAGREPYRDSNKIKLVDTRGINIVPFAVAPHFKDKYSGILENFCQKVDYSVVAITDEQAIIVKNGMFTLVGKGETRIFNKIAPALLVQQAV